MTLSRRAFLASAMALPAIAAPAARAIEPIRRGGKPHLRLSLAAYSFRQALDIKRKPRAMTLDDFADLAAALNLDAIEPTAYYFDDTSPEYLSRLKLHCTRLGLDVSGGAVGNDFCTPDADKLKGQLAYVRDWVERYALLGAKTVRIFAGNVAKGDSEEKARARCVAAIEESCDHAAKHGVYLALENHGGITATAEQTLALVKAVRHPAFGVNLDTGNFRTADPYADIARLAPYAVTVQIKTEIRRAGGKNEEADLGRKLTILRDAGYRGYVALEYEAAEDAKIAVPRYVVQLQRLIAEQ
jgi:sugar phosphate isomerase/epimerase